MLGLQYITKIEESIDHARGQGPAFSKAAGLIAESVLRGGRLYIHDPGNMISAEALIRAAGLVMIKKFRVSDLPAANLSQNDVIVVFLKRSRLLGDLAFVRAIKRRGAKIVGVFPTDSPHAERPSLAEFSDVIIDNGLVIEGGVLDVDGFDEPICPIDVVVTRGSPAMTNVLVTSVPTFPGCPVRGTIVSPLSAG